MAGYLDEYGAGDERRARVNRWLMVSGGAVLFGLFVWWFLYSWDKSEIVREPHVARLVQKLRNHRQEGEVRQFLDLVKSGRYEDAYRVWHPNSDYPYYKFLEDWGPHGSYTASAYDIVKSRSCGTGAMITIDVNKSRQEILWVQRSDGSLSFSPYEVCPTGS
jgi:hypothetical protein